jgi:hypothetical protein
MVELCAHNKDDTKQVKRSDGGHLDNDANKWPWVFLVPGNFGFLNVWTILSQRYIVKIIQTLKSLKRSLLFVNSEIFVPLFYLRFYAFPVIFDAQN